MQTENFLKVTPKGGTISVVVPKQNRDFYLSQGAKVEPATEAEIRKAFPEYAERVDRAQREKSERRNVNDTLNHQVQKLTDKVAALEKENKAKDAKIAELESANAQLRMVAGGDAPEQPATPAKKTSRRKK